MDWQNEFRNYLETEGMAPNSISAYSSDMNIYADWFLTTNERQFDPHSLVGADVREYRRYCIEQARVKASTWNRRRASMAAFAIWSRAQNYIMGDPLHGVPEQDQRTLPPYWLKPKEFRAFRRQMEINVNRARLGTAERKAAVRDWAAFSLMLYAGLRVSEVVNMRREYLLLRERSGSVEIRNSKRNTDAILPLNFEARAAVSAWLSIAPDGELIFDVTARTMQRRIKELAVDARIENCDDITPHWLRHTFVRRLAVNDDGTINNPPGFVQHFARHQHQSTTERYYQANYADLERMAEGL
ncbi:MAG: tyrosine-type recombinase/integrase [Chloroflexi bacterium]|jgi:integrase|nr:tyrosine-type recombinase/integrase [Chloroflexota bacterium]